MTTGRRDGSGHRGALRAWLRPGIGVKRWLLVVLVGELLLALAGAFVLSQPAARSFLDFADEFFAFAIPAYVSEGKSRLTVAIGCTGGKHRSVAIAEKLGGSFAGRFPVRVRHRDLEDGP